MRTTGDPAPPATANAPAPAARARAALAHPLTAVLAAALALRLLLTPLYANLPNGTTDEGFWKHWMLRIDEHGVLNIFRSSETDYVGLHWILWLLNLIYGITGGPYTDTAPFLHVLVKTPSIIFDLALIATVYACTAYVVRIAADGEAQRSRLRRAPLVAAVVIALQPAVVYDSAVWAQSDAAVAAVMLGALILANRGAPGWAGAVFALGFALKPHPIVIGPLLALAVWRSGGREGLARCALAAAAVYVAVIAPWLLHGDARGIAEAYRRMFDPERMRLSELAWNSWWIPDQLGDPRPGSAVLGWLPLLTWQRLAFALSSLASLLAFAYAWTRRDIISLLIAATYQAFAFYQLPVGAHERYLYPVLALLLPVLFLRPRWVPLYAALSVTFFLNLVTVAPPVRALMDDYVYGRFGQAVAGINTLLFAAFTAALLWQMLGQPAALRLRATQRAAPEARDPRTGLEGRRA